MMDLLKDRQSRYHLLLVGDGEFHDEVHIKAKEEHYLTWLPFSYSSERLADLYSAARIYWSTPGIVKPSAWFPWKLWPAAPACWRSKAAGWRRVCNMKFP